ncbi:MAG TPA: hypothetical protein PLK55_03475 [archaeon]|jgi:cell division protein FtsL|nr:hypothetical protein [archaeon]
MNRRQSRKKEITLKKVKDKSKHSVFWFILLIIVLFSFIFLMYNQYAAKDPNTEINRSPQYLNKDLVNRNYNPEIIVRNTPLNVNENINVDNN